MSEDRRLNVVVGVGGGIAAYKVVCVVRLLAEAGHRVRVVPTASALRFVGAATWAALSGNPVTDSAWDDVDQVPHVRIGQQAQVVVVAPATADLLARMATGAADDLLTNVLLTARCPVLVAPAMHTEMWLHPATVANVATLRARGITVLEPASGRLTGADTGPGRLPEPEQIVEAVNGLLIDGLPGEHDLRAVRVVVSAGGTREPLDPVRFLGNRSSGKQGVALAVAAARRGADVRLVAANVEALVLLDARRAGVDVVPVETAAQLRTAMTAAAEHADVLVMAAAVADFRPAEVAEHKIKKADDGDSAPVITLVRNPDILAELVRTRRPGQLVVGFAAETGDRHAGVLEHGRRKLAAKGCDLLVVNDVSEGKVFGSDRSEVVILGADASERKVPEASKSRVAHAVWDAVTATLRGNDSGSG